MIGNIKAPSALSPTTQGGGGKPDNRHRGNPEDDPDDAADAESVDPLGGAEDPVMLAGIRLSHLDAPERDSLVHIIQELDRLKREVEWGRDRLRKTEHLVDMHPTLPTLNRRGFAGRFDNIVGNLGSLSGGAALLVVRIINGEDLRMSMGIRAHDAALTAAATRIRETLHATDFVAALGGDDFAVMLLSGAEESVARQRERLLDVLNAETFVWNGKTVGLSAAAGSTILMSSDDPAGALERADRALRQGLSGDDGRV